MYAAVDKKYPPDKKFFVQHIRKWWKASSMGLDITVANIVTRLVFMLLAGIFLSGCLGSVKRNIAASSRTVAISGSISHNEPVPHLIVVVALKKENDRLKPFNYTYATRNDRYVLMVETDSNYQIVAFADRNNNLRLEPDEEIIAAKGDVRTPAVSGQMHIDLRPGDNGISTEDIRQLLYDLHSIRQQPLPVVLGEVTVLDDKRFSEDNGHHGLWHPFDFVTEIGVGIYFLEPYTPDRVPVLFVNGAGGSPRDWKYLIGQLDRKRYQPWVFLYPSGSRLEKSSTALADLIIQAKSNYGLKDLYLVAHSMGGLVTRGAMLRLEQSGNAELVRGFVSISTPWRGHDAAKIGAKYFPAAVPSWIDMVPDSDYQKWLFSRDISKETRYFMLFSYRGGMAVLTENNDGTVSLSSQLFLEAQKEASKVTGFNCTHTSILESPDVSGQLKSILTGLDRVK